MSTSGMMMSAMMKGKMNNYAFRGWEPDDKDELINLISAYIEEACPDLVASENNAHAFYSCAGASSHVALFEGNVVGFTLLSPITHIETRVRMIHSIGTYVLPDHRRKGVGRKLRELAMLWARDEGFERIQGYTYKTERTNDIIKLGGEVVGVVMETPLKR